MFFENQCVPKPFLLIVRQKKSPSFAPIQCFVDSRLIARTGTQQLRAISVKPPDAAKIQLLRAFWHGAFLPDKAAVFGPQNRSVRAAGPRNAVADGVDPAQARRCAGVLHRPRATPGLSGRRKGNSEKQTANGGANHGDNANKKAAEFCPSWRNSVPQRLKPVQIYLAHHSNRNERVMPVCL